MEKQKQHFALVSMSPDAVGVNAAIVEAINSVDGSILESHGQRHGELYTTSALIEIPAVAVRRFREKLGALGTDHTIHVRPTKVVSEPEAEGDVEVLLYSFDHAGIIHNFSRCLVPIRASIVKYGASRLSAAQSGAALFVATFRISLNPYDKSIVNLTEALSKLADEHGYDFDITPTDAGRTRAAAAQGQLAS